MDIVLMVAILGLIVAGLGMILRYDGAVWVGLILTSASFMYSVCWVFASGWGLTTF